MTGSRMAMSSDFLAGFAKLPSRQQRLVRVMIARFECDSGASGAPGLVEPVLAWWGEDRS